MAEHTDMDTNSFLVELGTEELPPKSLMKLANAFAEGIVSGLKDANLEIGDRTVYAAPRRLAVKIESCLLYTSPSPRDRQKSRMPSSA